MKLIDLNIWAGQILVPLRKFIHENKEADIFCFQEVYKTESGEKFINVIKNAPDARPDIYYQIEDLLPEHKGFFAPTQNTTGLAIFVKKSIDVVENGNIFVYKQKDAMISGDPNTTGRNLQFVKIKAGREYFLICNFHGIWAREGKKDSPQRIEQSENISKFLTQRKENIILCGDFNLEPNTKSLAILEEDLVNLIKKYSVKTTRTKLYDWFEKGDFYADYVLVSKDIKILDFKVMQDEVSDHAPLLLEFDS